MDAVLEQRYLDACRRGEAAAYRPLVEEYYPRAVRFARALVGDLEDARDVAQEAFVAAYRALPEHHRGMPFYPWLRGILVNRAKMFVRTRNRARARVDTAAAEPDHWTTPRALTPGTAAQRDLLRRAMEVLDADDRTLLVLKHVEGFTYDELAAALGIPGGTVMSRLYRARQRLRRRLLELAPDLDEEIGSGQERQR